MSRRMQVALLVIVPVAVFAGMLAIDRAVSFSGRGYDYVLRFDLPPLDGEVDLPKILGPQDASRPLVVIDPGHGGHDPGAGKIPLLEKQVTLKLARAIRDKLLADGGVRVALTRDDDRYLLLSERSSIARRLDADVFLSVHADSADNSDARGASVYILSEKGSSEAAARIAARENLSDNLNGVQLASGNDTVNSILLELSQREAQAGASELANLILREIDGRMPVHTGRVQSAAFGVLKAPDIPSVLFEAGYISNAQDAAFLTSSEGADILATSAAKAVRVFFARRSGI